MKLLLKTSFGEQNFNDSNIGENCFKIGFEYIRLINIESIKDCENYIK